MYNIILRRNGKEIRASVVNFNAAVEHLQWQEGASVACRTYEAVDALMQEVEPVYVGYDVIDQLGRGTITRYTPSVSGLRVSMRKTGVVVVTPHTIQSYYEHDMNNPHHPLSFNQSYMWDSIRRASPTYRSAVAVLCTYPIMPLSDVFDMYESE